MVYEIDFLRTGEKCLELIGDDHPKLTTTLKSALQQKKHELPALIWQATLGGEEFRDFWKFGSRPLPERFDSDGALILALHQLEQETGRWLAGDYRIDAARLEHQLHVVRQGNGGVQLRAWSELSNRLDMATEILRARRARRPLCFKGMHTPTADIFGNVVREVFIERIQAWSARLDARYYEVFPEVRRLERQLTAGEPAAYRTWRLDRDASLHDRRAALARHVEALRPFLVQCNLMPVAGARGGPG